MRTFGAERTGESDQSYVVYLLSALPGFDKMVGSPHYLFTSYSFFREISPDGRGKVVRVWVYKVRINSNVYIWTKTR